MSASAPAPSLLPGWLGTSQPVTSRLSPGRRLLAAGAGDVFAALLIIAAAFSPFMADRPETVMERAIVIAPAFLLPLRRRWPVPVLALCLVAYGAAAMTGVLAHGVVLASAIAMFGVANRSDRRRTTLVAGVAIAGIVGLSLLAAISSAADPRVVQFAVTIAFSAAAGDATRSRREYIVAITERAERAEQTREAEARRRVSEERLRIARDLHDVVAHQISVISLNAGVASSSLRSRPDRAEESLGTIRSAARTVLGEIGDLLAMLRAEGDDAVDRAAPPQGLDGLDGLVSEFATAGLDVRVRVEGTIDELPATVDVVAYRVLQEALTNALKHGAERRAHVLVSAGPAAVEIVVTNPTMPAAPDGDPTAASAGGYGLLGLRERVAAVRGTIDARPAAGGFRLAATLPTTVDDAERFDAAVRPDPTVRPGPPGRPDPEETT